MNILRIYTLDYLRRNRRTAYSIMIAILLVTTMLSSLCGICVTFWSDIVRLSQQERGNWHGELFDATFGRDLDLIQNHASVEATLIKGAWSSMLLDPENEKRPYLIVRGANKDYWESMPERTLILRGRVPQAPDELALSKQYFDDHPETQIGDVLTLPHGNRTVNGEALYDTEPFTPGETLMQTGTSTYTIVGELDIATPSSTPAYSGLGYLDVSSIAPDDQIVVYLRFHRMQDTYRELPKIAQALGWQTDEYGEYNLKYNGSYLAHYLIFPDGILRNFSLQKILLPLTGVLIFALVVGVFVLIIHNSFAVSANSRLIHLGILTSIGATPKQIRQSVVFEGFLLTLIPLPLGLLFGWLLDSSFFAFLNQSSARMSDSGDIIFTYGFPACVLSVVLTLITVYLSALIPARQVSKLSPITAIRQGDSLQLGKSCRHPLLSRVFGLTGELSARALDARRKSYRTATLSLTLSFVTLTTIFYIYSVQNAADSIYPPDLSKNQIQFSTQNGVPLTEEQIQHLRATTGIASIDFYSNIRFSIHVPSEMQSLAFHQADGSLSAISDSKQFYLTQQPDHMYRMELSVLGLDHDAFRAYCSQQGIDPEPYFQDENRMILYNQTLSKTQSTRRNPVYYPILNLSVGDTLTLHERVFDSDASDTFQPKMTIGDFADALPDIPFQLSYYTPLAIVPLQTEQSLARQNNNRSLRGLDMVGYATIQTQAESPNFSPDIQTASASLEAKLDQMYGSGDYYIRNIADTIETKKFSQRLILQITFFVSLLIALIGLSNIASTITGTLRQRRREFAMLRSVGLSPNALHKMLFLEALFLGLRPVLWSLPLQVGILGFFLFICEVRISEYLPFFPLFPLITFLLLVLVTVILCYKIGGKHLHEKNILESLRDDLL